MNQRRNSQSETTYAQCGRQHFHPTFAVATSAGSMIPAWPREQQHHPGRKGRVTNVHPERGHHPSGRKARRMRPTSILQRPPWDLLCWQWRKASWVSQSVGEAGSLYVAPQMPMSPKSVHFPSPATWSQKASVGLPRLPLLGERMQKRGPAPHHCQLVPRNED